MISMLRKVYTNNRHRRIFAPLVYSACVIQSLRQCTKRLPWDLKILPRDSLFLFKTSAPLVVYKAHLKRAHKAFIQRNNTGNYQESVDKFQRVIQAGNFSKDWFSGNIPYWLMLFKKYGIDKIDAKILEIGSWEGMSSLFILTKLPKAQLTCVDTWKGSDEHKGQEEILNETEKNFDTNLRPYENRLTKFKGTSLSFFGSCCEKAQFDLIYVDGSHYYDDVICDAINAFAHLKVGGIMIFDDYFWAFYKRPIDNPAGAINVFLKLKHGDYEIIAFYYQLVIRKTIDRSNLQARS